MSRKEFFIHPDIAQAETLPSIFYSDPEIYEEAKERIFLPSWQLVGDLDMVKIPGQVHPITLLEGVIDEPLLLTRSLDDKVNCLSNVCTHRGTLVAECPGNHKNLRCRYHGRKFSLDGKFESMPEFEGVKCFPTKRDDLPSVEFGQLGKLLFASLKPEISFNDFIKPVLDRVSFLPLAKLDQLPAYTRDYVVQAHWALYCENYLEAFHIPFVHPSLTKMLEFSEYRTELFGSSVLQIGVARSGERVFELPKDSPEFGKPICAYYFWLWPNLMLNFYPWGLSVNIVKPLGLNRTKVSYLTYVYPNERYDDSEITFLDRVEREDEEVVEMVQRGLKSRLYTAGRVSPTQEQGLHHFQRMIADRF